MAKLVLLSEGFTGRTQELITDRTTVGRVEDNTFQIADPSVSSHHAEILLRGEDVVLKDLNSTNGSFVDGQQLSGEVTLKHGQIVRLGQIQMRLETAAGAASAPPAKKQIDQTMVMEKRGGVSLNELEAGPRGAAGFDKSSTAFAKKSNKTNLWFIVGGSVLALIIIGGIIVAFLSINKK